jgi:hypothetical protein
MHKQGAPSALHEHALSSPRNVPFTMHHKNSCRVQHKTHFHATSVEQQQIDQREDTTEMTCGTRPQNQPLDAILDSESASRHARMIAQVPVKPRVPRLSKKALQLRRCKVLQSPGHTSQLQSGRIAPVNHKCLQPYCKHSRDMCAVGEGKGVLSEAVQNTGWPSGQRSAGAGLGNFGLSTMAQWLHQCQHLLDAACLQDKNCAAVQASQQNAHCWAA